jgi:predicted nucleic acid-binding protein
VIVYLDTSAMVPLLIAEPTSDACRDLWDSADTVATSQIAYAEVAAALAMAQLRKRITVRQGTAALRLLDRLWAEVDVVAVDDDLVRRAARLARDHGVRGYDAVHCASAEQLNDPDLVFVSGDHKLLAAATALGLSTADVTSP